MTRTDRHALRRAYEAAWAERQASGNTADEVLERQLRGAGILGDEGQEGARELILDIWRRGISPRRLGWEITKLGARTAAVLGRTFLDVARMLKGGRTYVARPFEPRVPTAELLALSDEWYTDPDGRRHYDVWFDVRDTAEPDAWVIADELRIGSARLKTAEWRALSAALDQYADGTVVLHVRDGRITQVELLYGGIGEKEPDDEDDDDLS